MIGAALGALDRALLPLGALGAAFVTLGASMLVTGAFHEDGLADTCDALGGAYDRAKLVDILKDSRIGSFGGAALVGQHRRARRARREARRIGARGRCRSSSRAARGGPVVADGGAPLRDAGERGEEQSSSRAAGSSQALRRRVATRSSRARRSSSVGSSRRRRAAALVVAMASVAALTGWRYARRLGGVTGDFLGATEQLAEIAGFAVLAWGAS